MVGVTKSLGSRRPRFLRAQISSGPAPRINKITSKCNDDTAAVKLVLSPLAQLFNRSVATSIECTQIHIITGIPHCTERSLTSRSMRILAPRNAIATQPAPVKPIAPVIAALSAGLIAKPND